MPTALGTGPLDPTQGDPSAPVVNPLQELIAAMTPPSIDYASFFGGEGKPKYQAISQAVGQLADWANSANLQRFGAMMGEMEGLGESGRQRIADTEQKQVASGTQNLISRGLFNTTMGVDLERAAASDAERARQQLEEGISAQKAGMIERANTAGPDMGMLSQLIQMAAGSTAGQGAGTTGGGQLPTGKIDPVNVFVPGTPPSQGGGGASIGNFSGDTPSAGTPSGGGGVTYGHFAGPEAGKGGPPTYTGIEGINSLSAALREAKGNMAVPSIRLAGSLATQGRLDEAKDILFRAGGSGFANQFKSSAGSPGATGGTIMGPAGTTAVPNPGTPGSPAPAGTTLNTMPDGTQFSAAPLSQVLAPKK